ncbi:MAG TPA: hypothetical protein VGO18_13905 [Steroidobacteraceae bacterium]|jgi:hypothetical protein|nr:hypothetical protein [Steroidobacteraceae bacterium]
MATKGKVTNDGPPRWTYVAGAIVAIGGLGWGVVSFFISKFEQSKPMVTAPAPSASVSVSGNGSVGLGSMSGGSINVGGAAATQPAVATSVPAKAGSSLQ